MAGVAAQAVVVVHLTYLLYVLFGGLLGLRSLHWLWPHLVTSFWGAVGVAGQLGCPLTVLQKYLIGLDGGEPYDGSFIGHYVAGVFYPAAWQGLVWWATASFVLASYVAALVRHGTDHRLAAHH
ncbi:MAG: DUF2784 domain-containing protein [Actinomycetota bacterium]